MAKNWQKAQRSQNINQARIIQDLLEMKSATKKPKVGQQLGPAREKTKLEGDIQKARKKENVITNEMQSRIAKWIKSETNQKLLLTRYFIKQEEGFNEMRNIVSGLSKNFVQMTENRCSDASADLLAKLFS